MSTRDLSPVSYVVLGLIARDGPSTAYELKNAVGKGIATFWPFPHSQIYAETEWLAELGLLAEEREESGRRRRIYRITPAGQAALRRWLADPVSDRMQFRSLGLLKLFFGKFARPEDLAALAASQREGIDDVLARFGEVVARVEARGDRPHQVAVGELLLDLHRTMAQHWKRIEREAREQAARPRPSRAKSRARRRASG